MALGLIIWGTIYLPWCLPNQYKPTWLVDFGYIPLNSVLFWDPAWISWEVEGFYLDTILESLKDLAVALGHELGWLKLLESFADIYFLCWWLDSSSCPICFVGSDFLIELYFILFAMWAVWNHSKIGST